MAAETKTKKSSTRTRTSAPVSYDKGEINPPRETSKRYKIAAAIKEGGQTIATLSTKMRMNQKLIRNALLLLNRLNGYGIQEDGSGVLKITGF